MKYTRIIYGVSSVTVTDRALFNVWICHVLMVTVNIIQNKQLKQSAEYKPSRKETLFNMK